LDKAIDFLPEWCQKQPIQLWVLFGSRAAGQAHADSDVDLAIWPSEPLSTPTRLRWVRELETLLNREVSLALVSADLDPVLGMEICRHGRPVYEREPGLWSHHRWQLWFVYNDNLPFLQAARRRLHQFAEEVRRGA